MVVSFSLRRDTWIGLISDAWVMLSLRYLLHIAGELTVEVQVAPTAEASGKCCALSAELSVTL